MINKFFIIILFFGFFTSCNTDKSDRLSVARVFDEYLYLDEIPIVSQLNPQDSLLFIHNFSNKWASEKLLFKKAEYNLNTEALYVDSLVNVYRESLLIHYYKEAFIQTYLDTFIDDSLINNYYINNIDNFTLKEDIVKLNYIKIRNVAPNIEFVNQKYYFLDSLNVDTLEKYCFQYADKFFLGDVPWISWLDFLIQLPEKNRITLKDSPRVLQQKRRFELKDSIYSYFVFIQDFKLEGTYSPLEYVSSMVKKILINKRKKDIIFNIETELMQDAINNNNFEIYEKY